MSAKAALKSAKAALDTQNWKEAVIEARKVLESDSKNYFGNVFLGRALEKQGEYDDAVSAYKAATKIKPDEDLAWKGLCAVYEAQGLKAVSQHTASALELAQVYARKDDLDQCQNIVDKLVSHAKEYGTEHEYVQALEIQLPSSPIYDFLEGRLPHPQYTYITLVEITEKTERERINKEIGERRLRIGANRDQVTADVNRDVLSKSRREGFYVDIINWATDEDTRRQYEQKLFQFAYDLLLVLYPEDKAERREQVLKLAQDSVIVKQPIKLAWEVHLEWQDVKDLNTLDKNVLKEFIQFFPETGLAKVLQGFLCIRLKPKRHSGRSDQEAEGTAQNEEKDDDIFEPLQPEDQDLFLAEGLEDAKESALAHRIVGEQYLRLEEYGDCVEVARRNLKILGRNTKKTGLSFTYNTIASQTQLATSLVYFQSPKNHPEAQELFTMILSKDTENTAALLGIGLVYEEQDDFPRAAEFLSRALSQDSSNARIGVEAAWCNALTGDKPAGLEQLMSWLAYLNAQKYPDRQLKALTLYRIGRLMWDLDTDRASRKSRKGAYSYFISALKANINLAAAYTSLGVYHADYSRDKKRAQQCFQKAFELSYTEIYAAERLAQTFAEEGEWDIVEIIAQRVVDSGVAKPAPGSKKKGVSWPFAALGIVQMNRQDYPKSVVSFQAALRISPNDENTWIGLGESYHSSGRYIAAKRALEHAISMAETNESSVANGRSWFARYILSNVRRELGEFEQAIIGYHDGLALRPQEYGLRIALLQTLVERAWAAYQSGSFGLAAESAREALKEAESVETPRRGFDFWKVIGDSCSILALIPSAGDTNSLDTLPGLLETHTHDLVQTKDGLNFDTVSKSAELPTSSTTTHLYAALAYKTALTVSASEVHAQAVAWFNLGWALQNAHANLAADDKASTAAPPISLSALRKGAVQSFKTAIEHEARNADFWDALGVATTSTNPKVAQHSFIRALYLNERSARTWTNLGALYLQQQDHELAHQAFTRAQSADPDFIGAWVGEGCIAAAVGDTREALLHFTHAVEISDAASRQAKSRYAAAAFDSLLDAPRKQASSGRRSSSSSSSSSSSLPDLATTIFALRQLLAQTPSSLARLAYEHALALLLERAADHASAISHLVSVCDTLESRYETSESDADLQFFTTAKADLARNLASTGSFDDAAAHAETVLDLLSDDDDNDDDTSNSSTFSPGRNKAKLSAHLVLAQQQFHASNPSAGSASYRAAEALCPSDAAAADVQCMHARALYTLDSSESRAEAKDLLFGVVEAHPGHGRATQLLGAIACLDGDADVLDAVRDDLRGMTLADAETEADTDADVKASRVQRLLGAIAVLSPERERERERADGDGGDAERASARAEAQLAVVLRPFAADGWSALAATAAASATEKSGEGEERTGRAVAEMALATALHRAATVEPDAQTLARVTAGVGTAECALRACVMAPWADEGWQTLREIVAGTVA